MKRLKRECPLTSPVKVVQFGEGNFLRAFVDWMIDEMNQKADFDAAVRIIQPLPSGMGETLNEQGGVYTLVMRGVENGKILEKIRKIECVKDCLNPYTDWEKVVETFRGKALRFCFSNTTEAGIEYKAEPFREGGTQETFPAKLTSLLHERFLAGLPGLIFLPCELIEHNGSSLKAAMARYAADWKFGEDFAAYLEKENVFCNTLVDRIVAGYPNCEAPEIWERLGYEDRLLDCSEPFHFFVIEAPVSVEKELPFAKAGLNVVFVADQSPYRTRKVRFLNGAHTSSVLAAYLAGFDYVDEMVADAAFGKFLKKLLFEEIFTTVALPDAEKTQFAEAVLERFANPFAMHRLLSISLNSVAKWKVRVLPSLLDYTAAQGKLPPLLSFSLAALIAFYENRGGAGVNRVNAYPVSDDAAILEFFEQTWSEKKDDYAAIADTVLRESSFWGMDLRSVSGLAEATAENLKNIKASGIRLALAGLLK